MITKSSMRIRLSPAVYDDLIKIQGAIQACGYKRSLSEIISRLLPKSNEAFSELIKDLGGNLGGKMIDRLG